jgi:predicted PhzF superfamily epimerase YddE/YHI9
MDIPYYLVDAFTSSPFHGNPAGVCLLDNWPGDGLLQNIARENNLSETAFLIGDGREYELRWFTPSVEVDLCGHATLASAYVLYDILKVGRGPLLFHSRSGALHVSRAENGFFFLDFPSRKPDKIPCPELLRRALNREPQAVYQSRDIMAVFESEEDIIAIKPDFLLLQQLDALGIIVTAPGTETDFVSRFFAPSVGINEDPVTGSAHCTLVPYWAERLNRMQLTARQVSQRGGELICTDKEKRVTIGGQAVLYLTGTINLPD